MLPYDKCFNSFDTDTHTVTVITIATVYWGVMFEALRDRLRYGNSDLTVVSYHHPIPDDVDDEQLPDNYVEHDTMAGSVWLRYGGLEVPVWELKCGSSFFSIYSNYSDGEETELGSTVATLLTLPDNETIAEWTDVFNEQPFHIRAFINEFVQEFDQDTNSVEMEVLWRWAYENSEVVGND